MSRVTRALVALVSVLLAWIVSDALSSQDIWVRMIAALLTAVIVIALATLLFGRGTKDR